jgi:hypothetical protein
MVSLSCLILKMKKATSLSQIMFVKYSNYLIKLLLENLYLNILGKHAKILKFLSFFFFFFDNLLLGSIEITIKSLSSKFFNSYSFGSKHIILPH